MAQTKTPPPAKRSVKLTAEERKALKKHFANFGTKTEAAEALNVERVTADRVLLLGSGHSKTIKTIRKSLKLS